MMRLGPFPFQLAGALCLLAGCRLSQSATDRALERMDEQPRYDVYEASRFFRNGMTMQVPPAGTVSREAMLDRGLATGRTASGGYLAAPPMPLTPALLTLGRSRFRIYCAVCHGAGGYGGSIVASNMTERRPPSLRTAATRSLPAGFFYEVISRGLGRMPSYADQLTIEERWAVVAYVRELQSAPRAQPDERADSLRGAELRSADSLRVAAGDTLP
jgi:mono/diheme cytochrome c family protein